MKKILNSILLVFFTSAVFAQIIHNEVDYYKSDSIVEFSEWKNYYNVYLKVELKNCARLTNSTEYEYSYKYILEYYDENAIPKSGREIFGEIEKFYMNDSALFFCKNFSEKQLYMLFNDKRERNQVFFQENKRDSCYFTIPGTNATVYYGAGEKKDKTRIVYEKLFPLIEYEFTSGKGITFFKLERLGIWSSIPFRRCAEIDIPSNVLNDFQHWPPAMKTSAKEKASSTKYSKAPKAQKKKKIKKSSCK